MDFKLFELSLISTHLLFNHLRIVLFGYAAQVRDARNSALLTLSNLAQEVDVFKLVDRELEILLHMLEKQLIEGFLGGPVNQTVSVDTLRFVDEGYDQRTSVRNLVTEKLEDQLGDHSWRE